MGNIDFTYADTGENIRNKDGYIYVTKAFQNATKISSPLRFTWVDEYGDFECVIGRKKVELDIYAIYASELYLAGWTGQGTDGQYRKYLSLLRDKNFEDYRKLDDAGNSIRQDGVQAFVNHSKFSDIFIPVTIKANGDLKKRVEETNRTFTGRIPLLITKTKLPQEQTDDLIDIALKWGVVSDLDPNQGWESTKNHFMIFTPEI